jgi:predicted Zn-dependent protease
LDDVISSASTNVELCYALASSLIKLGKLAQAEQAIERVSALSGASSRLHVLARFELGKALLLQGDVARAVTNLETAAKLDPENADFHYELGRAYTAAGRHEEAKRENQTSNTLKKQKAPH